MIVFIRARLWDMFHFIGVNWSTNFKIFTSHHSCVVVTGKRVNRGIGLEIEIPLDYFFHGNSRVIEWFKKFIEKLDKCTNVKVEKCMK